MTFAARLRQLRVERGLTIYQLANLAEMSKSAISMYERGQREPSFEILETLADIFNVDMDYLLGKSDIKVKNPVTPNAVFLPEQKIHMVPLYESASAGFGALANGNVIDYVPLYFIHDTEAEETICVKVQGDSMYPKIEDGDVIQVHRQESVDSGSLAVVLVDGDEALVKRVVYGEGWIELQSINPMYPPMRFEKNNVLRVRVVGAVRTIIKKV